MGSLGDDGVWLRAGLRRGRTRLARALAVAGNDAAAKATVVKLLDQFGFDSVDVGPLSESWRIQPDTPGYGPRRTASELRDDLAAATRRRTT